MLLTFFFFCLLDVYVNLGNMVFGSIYMPKKKKSREVFCVKSAKQVLQSNYVGNVVVSPK